MGLDLTQIKLTTRSYNVANKKAFDAYKKYDADQTDESIWNIDLKYNSNTDRYVGEDITSPYDYIFEDNNSRVGSYSTLHKDWRDPMIAKVLEMERKLTDGERLSFTMFIAHSDCDGHYTIDQLRYMSEHLQWLFDEREASLLEEYKDDGYDKITLTNWAQLLRDSHKKEYNNTVIIFC